MRTGRPVLGLFAALCLASCGWRAGLAPPPRIAGPEGTLELVPEGKTASVGVAMFEADRGVLERNLEPQVQSALTRAVLDRVDAPLVSPREADFVIRGDILEYRRRSGIRTSDNELLESGVRITLRAELAHRATGLVIGEPITRHVWSSYVLGGDNEDLARERALRNLAGMLIDDLFRPLRTLPFDPAASETPSPTEHETDREPADEARAGEGNGTDGDRDRSR